MSEEDKISGSRLLKAVEAIAISPAEAKKIVQKYLGQSRKKYPDDSDWQHQIALQTRSLIAMRSLLRWWAVLQRLQE